MISEIAERRSIRKYKEKPVPQAMIKEIIQAGALAPSSKNRQPWKFTVVTGNAKEEMLEVFRQGLERERISPLLPESAGHLGGAAYTLEIMRQAPAVIFCIHTLGLPLSQTLTVEERVSEICNVQSIGAALENMTLAAAGLGLGSLWICDTYFAQPELCRWLQTEGLAAAMAIGYADEAPAARPRKKVDEMIEWRS